MMRESLKIFVISVLIGFSLSLFYSELLWGASKEKGKDENKTVQTESPAKEQSIKKSKSSWNREEGSPSPGAAWTLIRASRSRKGLG
jgi:hypothetical protein